MCTPRRLATAVVWTVMMALFAASASAESNLAIVGQVFGPQGQILPGTLVRATARGFAESVLADESGRFWLPVPAARRYKVTVSLEGFQPVTFVAKIRAKGNLRPLFSVTLDYTPSCTMPQVVLETLSGSPDRSRHGGLN